MTANMTSNPATPRTIGHTPVVQLKRLAPPGGADVFVKLEYFNPTGSYKDRMALAMIEGAEVRGALRPGMRVIEYTGGSTGSSLAMVCAVKGYRFAPLSSDAFAPSFSNDAVSASSYDFHGSVTGDFSFPATSINTSGVERV